MTPRFGSHALTATIPTVLDRLRHLNWSLMILFSVVACIGFAMLYSAASGNWEPWAIRQIVRFCAGLVLATAIALIDLRLLMRWSYLAYGAVFTLLAAVELAGEIGMGAQRWINLGIFQLQPSELMKIAVIVALARYYHDLTHSQVGRARYLLIPLALVLAPAALVLRQPDLGTAGMIFLGGGAVIFLAGARGWLAYIIPALVILAVPVGWPFLRDYQKNRILMFLNPEADPLGAGYHILQSKIALGSGGLFGKGFLQGSQSHLNFLPERQTDFIFTMFAEEFGMAGALGLLTLFGLIIAYGFVIGLRVNSQFGRLMSLGVTTTLFLYVFTNIAMVIGLIPVVGVPLPLISYGGTVLLTMMIILGLLMCAYANRDTVIARHGAGED